MRPANGESGFTLIEMIVVLAILGMIAAMVVSRGPMRSQRLDLDGTARTLMASLRLARSRAIAQDRTVFWTAGPNGFGANGEAARPWPADVAMLRDLSVAFAADGSSSGGTVVLQGNGRALAIGVDWLTGRVHPIGPD